jgi:hypothetical protein
MSRGLLDFIISSEVLDAEDRHKINRCFAFLIRSLSTIIVASLPALLRNSMSLDPAGLCKHLTRAYSAARSPTSRLGPGTVQNVCTRWTKSSRGYIPTAIRPFTYPISYLPMP